MKNTKNELSIPTNPYEYLNLKIEGISDLQEILIERITNIEVHNSNMIKNIEKIKDVCENNNKELIRINAVSKLLWKISIIIPSVCLTTFSLGIFIGKANHLISSLFS